MSSEPGLVVELEAICDVCRRLSARNLLAAADGNVSIRLADGRIAITPSGVNKATVRPEQMAFMSISGATWSGRPSSERLMHLAI
jgi:L-fuculose-phosphate aldolase